MFLCNWVLTTSESRCLRNVSLSAGFRWIIVCFVEISQQDSDYLASFVSLHKVMSGAGEEKRVSVMSRRSFKKKIGNTSKW